MAFESLDALEWLRKHLEQDSPDLLREMVKQLRRTADVGRGRCHLRGRLRRAQPRAGQLAQRLPPSGL